MVVFIYSVLLILFVLNIILLVLIDIFFPCMKYSFERYLKPFGRVAMHKVIIIRAWKLEKFQEVLGERPENFLALRDCVELSHQEVLEL